MLSVRSVAAPALALVVAAGLAACGSDDSKDDDKATPSPTASESAASTYLEVPEGVTLTEPGTSLDLGEGGVIAFQRRQDEIGVLSVVVRRIERTSFQESFKGWSVDDATAARTPYFVRLAVRNVGDTDLGGLRLDNVLWADDGENLEAPNYYPATQLPACSGAPLPTAFAKGATAELCQVYFVAPAHSFEAVAFLPFGGLDPITWSGELSPVTKPGRAGKPGKTGKPGQNATKGKKGTKGKTGKKGATAGAGTPSAS